MTFLNSAFLFALAAISIPLIIHFLSKRRIKTIEFSSLKFLEQMQKSRMRWLKIKELLLLLLRMAVIALIVLAFARPTIKGFAGSSRATSSIIILLDRSPSMDSDGLTGSLFDEAKRTTARLIDLFETDDQVTIIPFPFHGTPEIYGPYGPGAEIRQRLNNIDLGYSKGDIGPALLDAIRQMDKTANLNREIYIISDFQGNAWSSIPSELLHYPAWNKIRLFMVPLNSGSAANISIDNIIMPPQLLVAGQDFEIEAEIVNHGQGQLENLLAGVTINNERKAQASVSLPPNQPVKARFQLRIEKPGLQDGYVEIDHDRYALDNTRYFTLNIPEKTSTLAVSGNTENLRFARLILERPEAAQISYSQAVISDLLRENLVDYDVIILYDLPDIDPARETALKNYLNTGGSLFVVLGRNSDYRYWNNFLKTNADITVGEISGSMGEFVKWSQFDYSHPVFSIYAPAPNDQAGPRIPDIEIYRHFRLSGNNSIGSTADNVSLFVESPTKPVLVFGSGFDFSSSNLVTHSFFVPFLVRSLEYLGSRQNFDSFNGIIGANSSWRRVPGTAAAGSSLSQISLVSPDSLVRNLMPLSGESADVLNIVEYGIPGIYLVRDDRGPVARLAFNIDNTESSADQITAAQIQSRLGITPRVINPGSEFGPEVLQARIGRELWKEFLILAIILLIIESVLGRTSHLITKDTP